MLQFTKRVLVTAIAVAAVATPSAAYARINLEANAQQTGVAEGGASVPQAGGVQVPANGFDWGDAGIGAAASALLIGGGGIVVGRRRSARRVVVG